MKRIDFYCCGRLVKTTLFMFLRSLFASERLVGGNDLSCSGFCFSLE